MLNKSKILINVSNLNDIEKYEKLGVSNFLFPLKEYSIGYTSFSYNEMKSRGKNYCLINRILTDEDIDNLLKIEIPDYISGFIVEDIGLFYPLIETGREVILYQNHLNCNYYTINYWLGMFDSLVISTDITEGEIKKICEMASKDLVLNTFGYPMIMYSRRNLVNNFYRHIEKDIKDEITVQDRISDAKLRLIDSKYGTACFYDVISDYRSIIPSIDNKLKFYLINTEFISFDDIVKCINNEHVDNTSLGFLNKKTVYKIGDEL